MLEFNPIASNDFPDYIKERDEKLRKFENLIDLLRLKDQIIWDNILEKQDMVKKEPDDKKKEHDLSSFICHFCGVKVSESTINGNCLANNDNLSDDLKGNFTKSKGAIQVNSSKHHFGPPGKLVFDNNLNFNNANTNNHNNNMNNSVELVNTGRGGNLLNSPIGSPTGPVTRFQDDIDDSINNIINKMIIIAKKGNEDLDKFFSKYFKDNKISDMELFKAFLLTKLDLNESEINKIITYFGNPDNINNVINNNANNHNANNANNNNANNTMNQSQIMDNNTNNTNSQIIPGMVNFNKSKINNDNNSTANNNNNNENLQQSNGFMSTTANTQFDLNRMLNRAKDVPKLLEEKEKENQKDKENVNKEHNKE